jgi:hypothetical protein
MIRYLVLLMTMAACSFGQYAYNQPLTKGNVTITFRQVTVPENHTRVEIKTTDPKTNAFLVTVRSDYLGHLISRSYVIGRGPALPGMSRTVGDNVWGDITSFRSILIEEQQTAASQEF